MLTPAERIAKYFSYGPASIRDYRGLYWTHYGDIKLEAVASSPDLRLRQVINLKPGLAPGTLVSFWSTTSDGVYDLYTRLAAAVAPSSESGKAAASFDAVPGLSGRGLSFCRAELGTGVFKYLVVTDDDYLVLRADDASPTFRQQATFHIDRALSSDPLRHLTMMRVSTGFRPDKGAIWDKFVGEKESSSLRVYDVVIGKAAATAGGASVSVDIYTFADSYYEKPDALSWADHNAKYLMTRFPFDPASSTSLLAAMRNAASAVIGEARRRKELAQFGITYLGHGDPNGLFDGAIESPDDCEFLDHVTTALGARIDVLDWGSNCNVATVGNLRKHARHADYFIASDLELAMTEHNQTYSHYVTAGRTMRDIFEDGLRRDRSYYERGADRVKKNQRSEVVYLFDGRRYLELIAQIDLDAADDKAEFTANRDCSHLYNEGPQRVGDVLSYIRKQGNADAEATFEAMRLFSVDTKDMYWNSEYANANGLIMLNWLAG